MRLIKSSRWHWLGPQNGWVVSGPVQHQYLGGSMAMVVPHSWMVHKGKSVSKMDDDWGYPYFRKTPYVHMIVDDC